MRILSAAICWPSSVGQTVNASSSTCSAIGFALTDWTGASASTIIFSSASSPIVRSKPSRSLVTAAASSWYASGVRPAATNLSTAARSAPRL
jgi:hypothetical protein